MIGVVSETIDDTMAWWLVRRAREGFAGAPETTALTLEYAASASLVVEADGGWRADTPVGDTAAQLLDLYLPLAATPAAGLAIAQLGQSLDGRIATETGHSHYVTGSADLVHLHRLRALVDAVLVGAETVVADDPRLTVRRVEGDSPARVVLDPRRRVSPGCRAFAPGAASLRVVARSANATSAADEIALERRDGGFEPADIKAALARRGYRRILVEGGGLTISRFLRAGCLDRLHVTVAPMIIGSGRPGITLPAIDSLTDAWRPACRTYALGDDTLFDLGG